MIYGLGTNIFLIVFDEKSFDNVSKPDDKESVFIVKSVDRNQAFSIKMLTALPPKPTALISTFLMLLA